MRRGGRASRGRSSRGKIRPFSGALAQAYSRAGALPLRRTLAQARSRSGVLSRRRAPAQAYSRAGALSLRRTLRRSLCSPVLAARSLYARGLGTPVFPQTRWGRRETRRPHARSIRSAFPPPSVFVFELEGELAVIGDWIAKGVESTRPPFRGFFFFVHPKCCSRRFDFIFVRDDSDRGFHLGCYATVIGYWKVLSRFDWKIPSSTRAGPRWRHFEGFDKYLFSFFFFNSRPEPDDRSRFFADFLGFFFCCFFRCKRKAEDEGCRFDSPFPWAAAVDFARGKAFYGAFFEYDDTFGRATNFFFFAFAAKYSSFLQFQS